MPGVELEQPARERFSKAAGLSDVSTIRYTVGTVAFDSSHLTGSRYNTSILPLAAPQPPSAHQDASAPHGITSLFEQATLFSQRSLFG